MSESRQKWVNLTPHPILVSRLDSATGEELLAIIPVAETTLRLDEADAHVWKTWADPDHCRGVMPDPAMDNYQWAIPVVSRGYSVGGQIPPDDGRTIYIVSLPALMGMAAAGIDRPDVVAPDSGPGPWGAVRKGGQVHAVRRFVSLSPSPPSNVWGPFEVEGWEAANQIPAQ